MDVRPITEADIDLEYECICWDCEGQRVVEVARNKGKSHAEDPCYEDVWCETCEGRGYLPLK